MIPDQVGVPVLHTPLTPLQILQVDRLTALERQIQDSLPLVNLKAEHIFTPGLYARKLDIPKGVVLTGAIHKTQNLTVISKGRLAFMDEKQMQILPCGSHLITQVGSKRAMYALEDSTITTFHPTNETNVETLEKSLVAYSLEDYQASQEQQRK